MSHLETWIWIEAVRLWGRLQVLIMGMDLKLVAMLLQIWNFYYLFVLSISLSLSLWTVGKAYQAIKFWICDFEMATNYVMDWWGGSWEWDLSHAFLCFFMKLPMQFKTNAIDKAFHWIRCINICDCFFDINICDCFFDNDQIQVPTQPLVTCIHVIRIKLSEHSHPRMPFFLYK